MPNRVFKVADNEYHAFFKEQIPGGGYPKDFDLDLMISSDGINWDLTSIHRNVISQEQSGHIFNCYAAVIKQGDTYKVWHSATSDWNIAGTKLYYSTSKDGIHYTGHGKVLDNEPYPEYDSRNINAPWVVFDGSKYYLYYVAFPGRQSGPPDRNYHRTIACATSTDGIHWEKHGVVIDEEDVLYPSVVFDGTKFEMLYNVHEGERKLHVEYAVSYDGINWNRIGRVDSIDGLVVGFVKENGVYKVWYQRIPEGGGWPRELWYATASTRLDLALDDISFHGVTLDQEILTSSNEVDIAAKVINLTGAEVDNIKVRFLDKTSGDEIGIATLKKLGPYESAYVDVIWRLRSKVENHDIQAEIISPDDSNKRNNIASRRVSIYFAPFDLRVDAYSFPNKGLDPQTINQIIIEWEVGFPCIETMGPLLKLLLEYGGHCYGMAATSALYKEHPFLKPIPWKTTYQYKPYDPLVVKKIRDYHLSQLPLALRVLTDIFRWDLEREYKTLLSNLSNNHLVLLCMRGRSAPHAVTAYRIIDAGENKRVYVYDPDHPVYSPDLPWYNSIVYTVFNLKNGKFTGLLYELPSRHGFTEKYIDNSDSPLYDFVVVHLPAPLNTMEEICSRIIASLQGYMLLVFSCPISVLLTDQYGRRLGHIDSKIVNEIPKAAMEKLGEAEIYLVPVDLTYSIEITGTGEGRMNLSCLFPKGDQVYSLVYGDIPITKGTRALVNIGEGVTDLTMKVDSDGDGTIDFERNPSRYSAKVVPSHVTGLVRGSGWFLTSGRFRNSFMFEVRMSDGNIEPSSYLRYLDGRRRLYLASADISSLSISDNTASFEGECMINGKSGYSFRVTVTDGAPDTFEIVVRGGINYSSSGSLRGGDIKIILGGAPAPTVITEIPEKSMLLQNYPNPFNPETWIPFSLSKESDVTIEIYDLKGRLIRKLVLGRMPPGFYITRDKAAYWDGRNELGEKVSSGVYFYILKAGDFKAVKKMVVRR